MPGFGRQLPIIGNAPPRFHVQPHSVLLFPSRLALRKAATVVIESVHVSWVIDQIVHLAGVGLRVEKHLSHFAAPT